MFTCIHNMFITPIFHFDGWGGNQARGMVNIVVKGYRYLSIYCHSHYIALYIYIHIHTCTYTYTHN